MSNQRKRPRRQKDQLNTDTLEYYERVADTFKEGFESPEERELFLNNVFTQLEEEAVAVCRSPAASPVIENLVTKATAGHLQTLLTVFSTDWSTVYQDKNASHVLQGTLMALPAVIKEKLPTLCNEDLDSSDEAEIVLIRTILSLSDVLLESIEDSVRHTYTSHVVRAAIQVLGGAFVGDAVTRSKATRDRDKQDEGSKKEIGFKSFDIPKKFKKKLKMFCKRIFKLESFNVLLTDPNANPVLQTLLSVLKKVDLDLCKKYVLKVIKRSRITEVGVAAENTDVVKLPPVAQDNVGSYLVQQLITVADGDVHRELYTSLFQGRLLQFGLHPAANYVLQCLIKNCPETDLYGEIFDDLGQYVEDFLAVNHFGVVVAMAETCQRLVTRQQEFVQLLMTAFHCQEPVERQVKLVPLVAAFKSYETLYQVAGQDDQTEDKAEVADITRINYHGSLILQQLLRFSNPRHTTSSLLELRPLQLKTMSCDNCGSHVIDAFFESATVTDKVKDAMLNRMKVLLIDLACDRLGSRVIDAMWRCCNIKQKTLIAGELSAQESRLRGNKFGGFLYHKCALKLFSCRRSDWLGVQGAGAKKRKMFDDIFDSGKKGKKFHGNKHKGKKGGDSRPHKQTAT